MKRNFQILYLIQSNLSEGGVKMSFETIKRHQRCSSEYIRCSKDVRLWAKCSIVLSCGIIDLLNWIFDLLKP